MELVTETQVRGKLSKRTKRSLAPPERELTEAVLGLSATRKSLPAWLFYDATGSALFERITELPEYYLTRTERALLTKYADEILELASAGKSVSISELGSRTAAKTGILLQTAVTPHGLAFYQPIDVSQIILGTGPGDINQRNPDVTALPQLY